MCFFYCFEGVYGIVILWRYINFLYSSVYKILIFIDYFYSFNYDNKILKLSG